MIFHCCEPLRLEAVKRAGVLNGIEYLEVSDSEAPSPGLRQRTLLVRLLQPPGASVTASSVSITHQRSIPSQASMPRAGMFHARRYEDRAAPLAGSKPSANTGGSPLIDRTENGRPSRDASSISPDVTPRSAST